MTETQENRSQLAPGQILPDGETGMILAMLAPTSTTKPIQVPHNLGRVPSKAYVVESTGKFFLCKVVFKDAQRIHLLFNDTGGTALVRIG